jgi:hypothetical protein
MHMQIHELQCPLVFNTPKGKATAHFLIDYGIEQDLYWVCFIHKTGECWSYKNKDITIVENISRNRLYTNTNNVKKHKCHTCKDTGTVANNAFTGVCDACDAFDKKHNLLK